MRLIDADALIKSTDKEIVHMWEIALAPTVDAVPVIRCKDCVYFWDGVCTAHTDAICTDENEFCSWGERRDKKTASYYGDNKLIETVVIDEREKR